MNNRLAFYMPPHKYITSYFEIVDCANETGISKIEGFAGFEFEYPDKKAVKKLKEYADSKKVTFPCFSVYDCLLQTDYKEFASKLKEYAYVAAELGSPYLHHTIVGEYKNPGKVLPFKDELFEKGVKLVKEVSSYAKTLGVKAIYEEQGFLFNGIKNIERLLHETNGEVGIVADFGNICQAGERCEDFIKHFKEQIVHVHIKDILVNDDASGFKTLDGKYMHEVEPMCGEGEVLENIKLLESLGYKGSYAFEFGNREENINPLIRALTIAEGAII